MSGGGASHEESGRDSSILQRSKGSVDLTAVGFCVLKPQKPLNISMGRRVEGVLLFLFP